MRFDLPVMLAAEEHGPGRVMDLVLAERVEVMSLQADGDLAPLAVLDGLAAASGPDHQRLTELGLS